MLAQVTYWVNVMPAQQTANAMMSVNGGLQVGCWAIETAGVKVVDVLSGLRHAWADPLIQLEKAKEISASQLMRLDAIRQFRWVTEVLERRTLENGVSYQVVEPMESQLLNIVHNVKVEYC